MTSPDGFPQSGDVVHCVCWCEERYVFVPIERVRQGVTHSCGAPGCAEIGRKTEGER